MATHYQSMYYACMEHGLIDTAAKCSVTLLKYPEIISSDKAFYQAGVTVRDQGNTNLAFLLLNRSLAPYYDPPPLTLLTGMWTSQKPLTLAMRAFSTPETSTKRMPSPSMDLFLKLIIWKTRSDLPHPRLLAHPHTLPLVAV